MQKTVTINTANNTTTNVTTYTVAQFNAKYCATNVDISKLYNANIKYVVTLTQYNSNNKLIAQNSNFIFILANGDCALGLSNKRLFITNNYMHALTYTLKNMCYV